MNQILLTENKNDKNKNNKYISHTNKNDMKKIIMFFGIAILVLGIALAGVYGYKVYNKNKKKNVVVGKPQVSLEETEDAITIIAKSEVGINKIIYAWNDEEPQEVQMSGRTSHEEKIDIPAGKNTLIVKVIDQYEQENEIVKDFSKDKEKPVISLSIINTNVKIVATDETAMEYITYKWNDEEDEVKIEVENQGDKIIEEEVEIRRGNGILKIVAVDASGNTEESESSPILAWVPPEFDVKVADGKLYMKIIHDMGFEKIEFSVNGKEYKYDNTYSGYDATQKEIEYYFDLKQGENTVIIVATSNEGSSDTYKGKYNYTPE